MSLGVSTRGWLLVLTLVASAGADDSVPRKPATPAEKIAYYQRQVVDHPGHYAAYARLGRAWLEQARLTYDPAAVSKARQALQRSREIQPNYEALYELAAVANYSHRFEEALRWCREAGDAAPQDKSILAMKVEALLALGRADDARAELEPLEMTAADFYSAAARAHWYSAKNERQPAAASFLRAARLAQEQKAHKLAAWATASAAGVWLDHGQLALAKPLLEAAVQLDSADRFVKVHQAELAAAESQQEDALRIYEALVKDQPDPELHRRAFNLARQLGRKDSAAFHRDAAEKLCRVAIDAGEFYGLETLAQLYCDDGRRADAVRLAEQNLQHKRDAAAQETLARARQR